MPKGRTMPDKLFVELEQLLRLHLPNAPPNHLVQILALKPQLPIRHLPPVELIP